MDTERSLKNNQCFHYYAVQKNEAWRRMPLGLEFNFKASRLQVSHQKGLEFTSRDGCIQQQHQHAQLQSSDALNTVYWPHEFLYHLFDQDSGITAQLIGDTHWQDNISQGKRSLTRLVIPSGQSLCLNEVSVCDGCRRLEIIVGQGATLFHSIQLKGNRGYDHINIVLEPDAKYHQVSSVRGSVRRAQRVILKAKAEATIKLCAFAKSDEVWHEHVRLCHEGEGSKSQHDVNTLVQGALDVHSEVDVGSNAQYSQSVQKIEHLLLCEHAKVFSKPALDVRVDDVDCQHGAISRMLDNDLLFYLYARGLNQHEATQLYLMGYLQDAVKGNVRFSVDRYNFLADLLELNNE